MRTLPEVSNRLQNFTWLVGGFKMFGSDGTSHCLNP